MESTENPYFAKITFSKPSLAISQSVRCSFVEGEASLWKSR